MLELARRIVVEEGAAGVSAARLAREAPAPLPVVARNFRTRVAILAALRADLVDDRLHLVGGVGEVAGNVAAVDRLQHQGQPAVGGAIAGLLQIADEGAMHGRDVAAGRNEPRHDVQCLALEVPGVVERLVERRLEVGFAPGQGREAALALGGVAGRQVEQRLRQPVLLQLRRDVGGRRLVGEQDLDRLEAMGGGGAEALQERDLLVDPGQVGGKLGHS